MFLLALEACEFYEHLREAVPTENRIATHLIRQFFHIGWHGLHFWDLIQPAFMFMAGIAMAYSLTRQTEKGFSRNQQCIRILKRSGWLLFWGVFKRISSPDWLALEALDVTDVLTQLAFTTLIAFFLFRSSTGSLVLSCVTILLLTEVLYRFWNVSGYNEAFTNGKNFGNWLDLVLFGQHSQGYVFINWLPTAVHTIAGLLVGKMFLAQTHRLSALLIAAAALLLAGYGLDLAGITPIIKPIATSSFIMASLGYCLLMVCLFYWWIDAHQHRNGLLFFQVLGMNSIFIYLFFGIVGARWLNGYVQMVTTPVFEAIGIQGGLAPVLASLCTFTLEWLLCYFLYRKKIFFKL